MPLVGAELRAGRAMRQVRTAIMHGQRRTVANPVREWRHIQLPYFVLDPCSVGITFWLGNLDLRCHHFRWVRLLLFHTVSVVLGLEATEIHLHIPLGHTKA